MDKINDLLFESIWAVGDVLVMKRAAMKLDLERWSKDYWIDEWGEDECGESVLSFSSFSSCLRRESVLNFFPFFLRHVEVIDSQTREVFKVTVEDFFEKVSFRRVSLSLSFLSSFSLLTPDLSLRVWFAQFGDYTDRKHILKLKVRLST